MAPAFALRAGAGRPVPRRRQNAALIAAQSVRRASAANAAKSVAQTKSAAIRPRRTAAGSRAIRTASAAAARRTWSPAVVSGRTVRRRACAARNRTDASSNFRPALAGSRAALHGYAARPNVRFPWTRQSPTRSSRAARQGRLLWAASSSWELESRECAATRARFAAPARASPAARRGRSASAGSARKASAEWAWANVLLLRSLNLPETPTLWRLR